MRIRDLGPLVVEVGGYERPCSGRKQVAILATLARSAGRRVSVDALAVAGWGDDAAVSTSSIENHLWRLRHVLEPGRSRVGNRSCLVNDTGGYRLSVDRDAIDSVRFAELAERSRTAADPDEVLSSCEEALALWRGAPYEAIAHVSTTAADVARLVELRGQLVERRLHALLSRGDLDEVLVALRPVLDEYPFRERLWALRMTALARSGRVEESLGAYESARTLFRDELGLEPGPELRGLHRRVLAREPLEPATGGSGVAWGNDRGHPQVGDLEVPVHLPARVGGLIGREREVDELLAIVDPATSTTVVGPGGCGKTRLAVHIARTVAGRFGDGVHFVDLTELPAAAGVAPVVDLVVTRLGLRPDDGDGAGALRAFARDRRALLVLDNCEHVLDDIAAVVEDVLMPDRRMAVLATSREPMGVEDEVAWVLGPLSLRAVGPGHRSPAALLFDARAGAVDGDRGVDRRAVVERICAGVDGLPLAIELAAARSRSFSLGEIAQQVEGDPAGLGRVGRGPADHRSTLRSTIDWSHGLLGADEQLVHRRLAVLPGAFTLPVATATIGAELDVSEVPTVLARLVHRSLLVSVPAADGDGPTTFRQLETVRAHARRVLVESGEEAATLVRRDRWVGRLLAERPRLGHREEAAWYDVLEENDPTIRAALDAALTAEDPSRLREGAGLMWFWYYRSRVHEGARWLERAAIRVEDHPHDAIVYAALATALLLLVRPDEAREPIGKALALAQDIPPPDRIRVIEVLTSTVGGAWTLDEFDLAREIADAVARLAAGTDDPDVALLVDAARCVGCLGATSEAELGELETRASAVYELAVERGNDWGTWWAAAVLNIIALARRDARSGLLWTDRVIDATRRFGRGGCGVYTEALANFLLMDDDVVEAVRLYASASAQNRRDGMIWPARPGTRAFLERAAATLDRAEHEQVWAEGERLSFEDVVARRRARRRCSAPT